MFLIFGYSVLSCRARSQVPSDDYPFPLHALPYIRHSEDVEDGGDATAETGTHDGLVEHGDDGDEVYEPRHYLQHPDRQVESNSHQVSFPTEFALQICYSFKLLNIKSIF